MNASKQPIPESEPDITFYGLFKRHIERRFSKKDDDLDMNTPPPDQKPVIGAALRFLMIFPWFLILAFTASFWWDFDGISLKLPLVKPALMLDGMMRIVAVSGLIGFTTNWLAIQMLFYPRNRRPLLGQGLIPAQKDKIAIRLAHAVERELINPVLIKKEFVESGLMQKYMDVLIWDIKALTADEKFRKDLGVLFESLVRQTLTDPQIKKELIRQGEGIIMKSVETSAVERSALKLYLVVKGKTLSDMLEDVLTRLPDQLENAAEPVHVLIDSIPARLRKDRNRIEQLFVQILERIIDQIDIGKIVEENINRYDEEKLERLIRGTSDTHLNYIKYLGALIGTVGGLVIWNPMVSLILITIVALSVWSLDKLLYTGSDVG